MMVKRKKKTKSSGQLPAWMALLVVIIFKPWPYASDTEQDSQRKASVKTCSKECAISREITPNKHNFENEPRQISIPKSILRNIFSMPRLRMSLKQIPSLCFFHKPFPPPEGSETITVNQGTFLTAGLQGVL